MLCCCCCGVSASTEISPGIGLCAGLALGIGLCAGARATDSGALGGEGALEKRARYYRIKGEVTFFLK